MAGKIVDGRVVDENGINVFDGVPDLETLLGVLGGFASMCWTMPEGAGEFKSEELKAAVQSAKEKAEEIIRKHMRTLAENQLKIYARHLSEEERSLHAHAYALEVPLWN